MAKQYCIVKLILPALLLMELSAFAQRPVPSNYPVGAPINYVRTWDVIVPETNSSNLTTTTTIDKARMTTKYLDGLGRPIQTVVKGGSMVSGGSSVDMVSAVEYDPFGREQFKYLPFASTTATGSTAPLNDGSFKTNPFQQQAAFSTAQYPGESYYYGQTQFETSPLNRIEKSLAPGDSWMGGGRGVSAKYWINTAADDVKIWNVGSAAMGSFGGYSTFGTYPAGELYKNVTEDEGGKQVIEFKDKEGNVILKKVQLSATADDGSGRNHDGWLSTYYIYDDLGQLRCVIQPEGVKTLADPAKANWNLSYLSNVLLGEQCFRYEYDQRGRMIVKKVPGAGEVYMVYDARDRLVLTQDANMRNGGKWMVTQYDALNRPIKSGLWNNATTSFNSHLSSATGSTEYPSSANLSSGFELLSETHYDDYIGIPGGLSATLDNSFSSGYDFITSYNSAPLYAQEVAASQATRGMVTWSSVKVLGTSDYLHTVTLYDEKGRPIQTQSKNNTGGIDIATTQYDYSGKVLRTHLKHQMSSGSGQTYNIATRLGYDALGRLATTEKKVDGSAWKRISQVAYDALGQLKTKKLGGTVDVILPPNPDGTPNSVLGDPPIETLTYDYNIRGWMLGANREYAKQSSATTNYFGFDLGYDKQTVGSIGSYNAPQFNGNITGTTWKSKGDNEIRKYDFTYDNLNRITGAEFNQHTSGTFNQTAGVNFSMSNMTYDANGNIGSMSHKGLKLGTSPDIDQLAYTPIPNSNKLQAVTDGVASDNKLGDFTDNNTGSPDYAYDDNGNMISDANKGITAIQYNHLNLPQTFTVGAKGTINYTYDAGGNKLKKVTNDLTVSPTKVTTTLYLAGIYENDVLQFLSHEEGRIRYKPATGSTASSFEYDYMLKDHLGNVRMVLTDEQKMDIGPEVTFEDAAIENEQIFYEKVDLNRTTRSGNGDDLEQLLRKNTNSIGVGKLLKVMATDKLHIKVDYFVQSDPTDNSGADGLNAFLTDLITILSSPAAPAGIHGAGGVIGTNLNVPGTAFTNLLNQQSSAVSSSLPKAYLNILFFDEQFKFVPEGSEVIPVSSIGSNDQIFRVLADAKVAAKNGYAYVYVSNESNNFVYFDNFQVSHERGHILEETHYYPFGLTMHGISSKAVGGGENRRKYNGIELENDLDIQTYDAFFRELDPQTGRWWQIDPKIENMEAWSPYASNFDNPVTYMDPMGDEPDGCCKEQITNAVNFIEGAMLGMGIGAADNILGTNIRGQVSTIFEGTGAAGQGWNTGLTIADAGGVAFGVAEIVTGGGMALGGGIVTTGTAGIATPVSAPVAAAGVAIATHGVLTIANSANNLVNQNGKVNATAKQTGSYTNTHKSGKTYSGKGPMSRAAESASRIAKEYKDPLKKSAWKPSKSTREAFKAEDKRIQKNGGVGSDKNYNKVNSPGKKYNEQDKI